jgi:hypothetical protein
MKMNDTESRGTRKSRVPIFSQASDQRASRAFEKMRVPERKKWRAEARHWLKSHVG